MRDLKQSNSEKRKAEWFLQDARRQGMVLSGFQISALQYEKSSQLYCTRILDTMELDSSNTNQGNVCCTGWNAYVSLQSALAPIQRSATAGVGRWQWCPRLGYCHPPKNDGDWVSSSRWTLAQPNTLWVYGAGSSEWEFSVSCLSNTFLRISLNSTHKITEW